MATTADSLPGHHDPCPPGHISSSFGPKTLRHVVCPYFAVLVMSAASCVMTAECEFAICFQSAVFAMPAVCVGCELDLWCLWLHCLRRRSWPSC
eukprot:8442180-Alexandrium_andersonii.AAC.1